MQKAWAFLISENTLYFSEGAVCPEKLSTPVTQLIQGIYEQEPEMARKRVRSRIYASYELTPLCRAMVKVAAKRATGGSTRDRESSLLESPSLTGRRIAFPFPPLNLPSSPDSESSPPPPTASHREWMSWACRLAEQTQRQSERYRSDRPVAALLVSSDGQLQGAALNTNASNRTRHAELNLLQGLLAQNPGARIAPGSRLYVTLKPCRMCAAAIIQNALAPALLQVIFDQDDPGPNARQTDLDSLAKVHPKAQRALEFCTSGSE